MRMRTLTVALFSAVLLAGQPGAARAEDGGSEVGLALGAAALDVVYVPCKAIMAVGGLIAGGVVGTLTGGDTRAAYALWVPSAGGTFIVRPAQLDGTEPLDFFGKDYADKPSPRARTLEGSSIYEALYR